MKKLTYSLVVLMVFFPLLLTLSPVLASAESEDEENEREDGEHTGFEAGESENEEHEGNVLDSNSSDMILYITLAAIASVGGYSAFKVYQARKKSTKKLV